MGCGILVPQGAGESPPGAAKEVQLHLGSPVFLRIPLLKVGLKGNQKEPKTTSFGVRLFLTHSHVLCVFDANTLKHDCCSRSNHVNHAQHIPTVVL